MNTHEAPSVLQSRDWDEEYRRLTSTPEIPSDSSAWDARAANFTVKDSPSAYVNDFLRLAGLHPGESVLDMGCGAGHLAIPLAQAGHMVIAADFSEGMLGQLRQAMESRQLDGIDVKKMAWEDDWDEFGVGESCVDAVIASRSIATSASLEQHVRKMSRTARRLCCATVSIGTTPRIDNRIIGICGMQERGLRTHQYLLNILINLGYQPSCNYISSARDCGYDSFQQAQEDYRTMLLRCIEEQAWGLEDEARDLARFHRLLDEWLSEMLIENTDPTPECPGKLKLKETRVSTWAFIAWSPHKGRILQ